VAQLKDKYESELQSLTEKFSQDVATLEAQVAAQTTQHQVQARLHYECVFSNC
jgi:hypothetical protein